MDPQILQRMICRQPEISSWPELTALVERPIPISGVSAWDYPMIGCDAAGGATELALPASAAIVCALFSIRLVDDLLDEEPQGQYGRIGPGRAANMALALQAAGHRLLETSAAPDRIRTAAHDRLSRMCLLTAHGQDLDSREALTEADYWRSAEAKSCPMFATGLALGALFGGANDSMIDGLSRIGSLMGKLIQIGDDMFDSMATPARADWLRPRNNLAILFALEVEHPGRERLLELIPQNSDPSRLKEAQELLLRCGAISFCVFKFVETARAAQSFIETLPLPNRSPVERLLAVNVEPARRILSQVGLELPADLKIYPFS